ncbi:hypothetical protein GCM10023334_117380 [Nonomuraea thailandensis]
MQHIDHEASGIQPQRIGPLVESVFDGTIVHSGHIMLTSAAEARVPQGSAQRGPGRTVRRNHGYWQGSSCVTCHRHALRPPARSHYAISTYRANDDVTAFWGRQPQG